MLSGFGWIFYLICPCGFPFYLIFGIIGSMKVLLYLEGKSVLEKSGIGRALQHQMHALDLAGIPYTTDVLGDYDVVHINTYGPRSLLLLHAAKRGNKKVIMHGHSTKEDFENSFIGSNLFAPLFGKYLTHMYKKADFSLGFKIKKEKNFSFFIILILRKFFRIQIREFYF